jgi:hypothetical protein
MPFLSGGEYRSRTDDLLHAMPFLANFSIHKIVLYLFDYQ